MRRKAQYVFERTYDKSLKLLECEKNDNDNQKVPHGQEGPKELNLLNYFDNFFVWCRRIFAKIFRFKDSARLFVLRRFTLF